MANENENETNGQDGAGAPDKTDFRDEFFKAKQRLEQAEARVAEAEGTLEAVRSHPHVRAAAERFQRGLPPEAALTEAQAALQTAKDEGASSAELKALRGQVEQLTRQVQTLAPTAQQAAETAIGMQLREEGRKFCQDYGLDPQGEQAIAIAKAARRRADKTRELVGYEILSEFADVMGLQKKTAKGAGSTRETMPLERGGSAPVPSGGGSEGLPELKPGTPGWMNRAHERASAKWERDHASKGR